MWLHPEGSIHADVVVNAAGLWGREVAAMAGFELPLMTMEHQYFVTESIPEIAAKWSVDCLRWLIGMVNIIYARKEKDLLVGAYEKDGRFWAEDGTPTGFRP